MLAIQEAKKAQQDIDAARMVTENEERFENAFLKEKVNKAACLHVRDVPALDC